jgi:hypothetical protein
MNQTRLKVEVKPRGQRKPVETDLGFSWGPLNSLLLGVGVALIVVGYIALSRGSTTLAPVLLVSGYVVVIPASLVLVGRKRAEGE